MEAAGSSETSVHIYQTTYLPDHKVQYPITVIVTVGENFVSNMLQIWSDIFKTSHFKSRVHKPHYNPLSSFIYIEVFYLGVGLIVI
jgi:hypothetical protein